MPNSPNARPVREDGERVPARTQRRRHVHDSGEAELPRVFLYASRALRVPQLRHRHASVGHAVSTDLVNWTRVPTHCPRSPRRFRSDRDLDRICRATRDKRWDLFYTGATFTGADQIIQRIGLAIAADLLTWHKHDRNPLVSANFHWYEKARHDPESRDEHWRDPWVFKDPEGHGGTSHRQSRYRSR
jgi:beta-fructofuranosidase